ncbi:unnamed protein product [Effrenium voratum]|uniref:Uncharacterized protein n=1 Tax=Effrenium voratum TaxID=2562239 RepID=A0AA36N622_9DINO|nr:unnamed protein product [Effrenium voratum]
MTRLHPALLESSFFMTFKKQRNELEAEAIKDVSAELQGGGRKKRATLEGYEVHDHDAKTLTSTTVPSDAATDFEEPHAIQAPYVPQRVDTKLTKAKGLALQRELLQAFQSPGFQKRLHELERDHASPKNKNVKTAAYRIEFMKLVRSRQREIIPYYGFPATEEGIEAMLVALQEHKDDPDVFVNEAAINEALGLETRRQGKAEKIKVCDVRPKTLRGTSEMLRLMLSKLSKATFQQSIDSLKQAADFRAGRCGYEDDTSLWPVEFYEDPEGYYHLHGRDKLALSVHKQVLPLYGFTADKHGVQEMLQLCAKYLSDPEFAHLFDSVNAKLGMSPSACQRFRQLIAGYEPLPTGKARS